MVTKPKQAVGVTPCMVAVPTRTFRVPPCTIVMSHVVTRATTFNTIVAMGVTNDSMKSLTALTQEGLVSCCVNMGNNIFVEQCVTPFVYN